MQTENLISKQELENSLPNTLPRPQLLVDKIIGALDPSALNVGVSLNMILF